ncbi:MAG: fasciclin domain-containing protein [Bacteroidota bacterium]
MRHFIKTTFILGAMLLLAWSCNNDDDNGDTQLPALDIVETAQATADLSNLVAALTTADQSPNNNLIATLSGDGPFTVLAPTNQAFGDLLASLAPVGLGSLADFDTEAEQDLLAAILSYHVIGSAVLSTQLTDGQVVATSQGESLTVSTESGVSFTDASGEASNVSAADITTSNGVVHVIDRVLLPQVALDAVAALQASAKNIVEVAQETADLSSLVAALVKADESPNNDLVTTLSGDGPFTVLAPTNAAFTSLFERLEGYSSLDDFDTEAEQDLLAAILSYHVISGAAVTADQLDGSDVTTVLQEDLGVSIEGGVSFIDAASESALVTTADVITSNGVVHIIDKVLIPQAAIDALNGVILFPITNLAILNPNLSSLVAALQAADGDLPTVLAGNGPFTVLAPTNAAFEAFLDGTPLSEIPTAVLTQVLLNHVIPGEVTATDLMMAGTGYTNTLAAGPVADTNISIYYDATDGVEFNGVSSVIAADIKALNGIVHVVDTVIDIPNIVDHAVANDNFTSLVGALTSDSNTVDFVSVLSSTEKVYTVFAPVNSAFAAFTNPDGNALQDILLNHVIGGTVATAGSLSNGYANTLATYAENENLSIYINTDDGVTLNGISAVVVADVIASNGVIHAVDTVIDLPTVTTFAVADPTFSTLATALTTLTPATDFAGILSRTNVGNADAINPPYTVFAPTNDAFDALDAIPGENNLTRILRHHVGGPGNIRSEDLVEGNNILHTLQGDDLTVVVPGMGDNIANITDGAGNTDIGIIAVDVQANNGVIHVINKVMIPEVLGAN